MIEMSASCLDIKLVIENGANITDKTNQLI